MGDWLFKGWAAASFSESRSCGSELARAPRRSGDTIHQRGREAAAAANHTSPAYFAFWQFSFLGKLNIESCILRALRDQHPLFPAQENLVGPRGIFPPNNRVCMAAINNTITEPDNK